MRTYRVYYLPNAIRKYEDGLVIKGKVGYTSLTIKQRNRNQSADVSDWRILVDNIPTKKEAIRLEKRYQEILKCLDGVNNPALNKKRAALLSSIKIGKPLSETNKIALRIPQEKWKCPVCGKVGGIKTMKQWGHGDTCTKLNS